MTWGSAPRSTPTPEREALEAFPWVANVLPAHELSAGAVADSFVALYRASRHPERRTAPTHLMVRERARTYVTDEPQGTGHGHPPGTTDGCRS